MTEQPLPAELLAAREKIDIVDRELVRLLSDRFRLTREVGLIKAAQNLPAQDSHREADKLDGLRQLCEGQDLNPDLVVSLFAQIMREVVLNHEKQRQGLPLA